MVTESETEKVSRLQQLGNAVSKIEQAIENNKKTVLTSAILIVLLISGFFAYKNLYLEKKQNEALSTMWLAQNQFAIDSFHIALYGNENVTGFIDIVEDYGNTKAGNTACLYAGSCAMHLGEFDLAIDYLKKFSTNDPILKSEAICLLGDAYSEMENYDQAITYYNRAAKVADNENLSPRCLLKAGILYEHMGKKTEALKAYSKIKSDYSNSIEASTIDKYITRVQYTN